MFSFFREWLSFFDIARKMSKRFKIILRFQCELWVAIKNKTASIYGSVSSIMSHFRVLSDRCRSITTWHQAQVDLQTVRSNMQALHESGCEFFLFFFRSWKLGSFRVSSFAGLGSLKRERCCYGCVDNSNSETFKYFNKLQNIYCAGERSAVCCSHNILLNVKFIFWIIIDLHWLLVHRVVFEFVLLDHFFHSLFGWTKWQLIEDDSCTILFTWYPCQPWGTYMIVFIDVIFLV